MKHHRVVIKIGTSTLTGGNSGLNRARMLEIVQAVNTIRQKGCEVVVVTSGAQAAGREVLSGSRIVSGSGTRQLLAAVGQGRLIEVWENLFSIYGIHIGQLLLTRADLEDRERYLNARDALFAILDQGVVPVINENDAVTTTKIKVGDNDNLAALVAVLAECDLLMLLTDQKGLYSADPRTDPEARLIERVDAVDEKLMQLAGGAGSGQGTGGMQTKLQAAQVATRAGIAVVIAAGECPRQIPALVNGSGTGTFFMPAVHPVDARKSWLSSATRTTGEIVVDDGAKAALVSHGSSLLPKGITAVNGEFLRGATVRIAGSDGSEIGRGLSRYTSEELRSLKGRHSDEIEAVLGFSRGAVAVHRDDLALTLRK